MGGMNGYGWGFGPVYARYAETTPALFPCWLNVCC